jgi:hypothetical protein
VFTRDSIVAALLRLTPASLRVGTKLGTAESSTHPISTIVGPGIGPGPSTHTHCGNFYLRASVNTGLFQQWPHCGPGEHAVTRIGRGQARVCCTSLAGLARVRPAEKTMSVAFINYSVEGADAVQLISRRWCRFGDLDRERRQLLGKDRYGSRFG